MFYHDGKDIKSIPAGALIPHWSEIKQVHLGGNAEGWKPYNPSEDVKRRQLHMGCATHCTAVSRKNISNIPILSCPHSLNEITLLLAVWPFFLMFGRSGDLSKLFSPVAAVGKKGLQNARNTEPSVIVVIVHNGIG